MEFTENYSKPTYGLITPNTWDLLQTKLTPENETRLEEKFRSGEFKWWFVKSPVWYSRVCDAKADRCRIMLTYKAAEKIGVPYAYLNNEHLSIRQCRFTVQNTLMVREDIDDWKEIKDVDMIAKNFGFGSVKIYEAYRSQKISAYQDYFLISFDPHSEWL